MFSIKFLRCWFISILVLAIFPTIGLSQLTLDGEFRPRTEFRNGYRVLRTENTKPAFFTSQRTRLSLNYKNDRYEIGISGQDVRVWGGVNQLQDNPNVNIHEAWATLSVTKSLGLKLGRQELIYDDHRLLGSVNWTQQARSHDALVLAYQEDGKKFKVDIGGAYNQESENLLGNSYALNNYKVLSYLWLNKEFGPLSVSAIGLTDGFERPAGSVNFRYTYGTHLVLSKEDWILTGSLYFQNGDDATRNNIAASMYSAKVTYPVNSIKLTAGFDHLSGGDVGDQNLSRHAFSTLYATNHKFYGNMDYFLNIPGDTHGGGLQDLYLQANYSWSKGSGINSTYHYFALSGNVADPLNSAQTLDKGLGSEIDLNISHTFTPDITFKIGYSMLFADDSLEHLQQDNAETLQHWGWVMLSLTPEFLN